MQAAATPEQRKSKGGQKAAETQEQRSVWGGGGGARENTNARIHGGGGHTEKPTAKGNPPTRAQAHGIRGRNYGKARA